MNENNVCSKCGSPINAGAKFCTKCGTRVENKPVINEAPKNNIQEPINESTPIEQQPKEMPMNNMPYNGNPNYGQNNYQPQYYMPPKKTNSLVYVIIIIILLAGIGAGVYFLIIKPNADKPEPTPTPAPTEAPTATPEPTQAPTAEPTTTSVTFEGFTFKVPLNYNHKIEDGALTFSNSAETWYALVKVISGDYNKLISNKDTVISSIESSGYKVDTYDQKTYSGMPCITMETSSGGYKALLAYVKGSSSKVFVVSVVRTTNIYDYDLFKDVVEVLSTSKVYD